MSCFLTFLVHFKHSRLRQLMVEFVTILQLMVQCYISFCLPF